MTISSAQPSSAYDTTDITKLDSGNNQNFEFAIQLLHSSKKSDAYKGADYSNAFECFLTRTIYQWAIFGHHQLL